MRYRRFLIGGLALLLSPLAQADALASLDRFRQQDQPLSLQFVQILRADDGALLERQQGRLEILPPDRFIWRYTEPYVLEFGSNGVLAWHWDPSLAQITVRDARAQWQGTPLALLLDRDGTLPEVESDGEWLVWRPSGEAAQFSELRLRMGARSPEQLLLRDYLGQITDITFSQLKRPDPSVDPRYPSLGPDTTVVDEREL